METSVDIDEVANLYVKDIFMVKQVRLPFSSGFSHQGPVVQSWVSANPGLKFNPLF